MTQRGVQISEGKSKILFETEDPKVLLQVFKDDATAFNGVKKGTIAGKGTYNCQISARMFRMLEAEGIRTHFIDLASDNEMLVKRVEIVPLEVVLRNRIAGSLAKRFGLEEGPELRKPLLEFFLKDDDLGDPLVTLTHIDMFEWADKDTVAKLTELGYRVNDLMKAFFADLGISLVDFKLEFGYADGELLLADEISPDGCRLWDAATGEKLDKDRFRRDLGNVEGAYSRVADAVADAISL
jgi:phosphoribosylaminoimidazole-succinocarboxamide synthase